MSHELQCGWDWLTVKEYARLRNVHERTVRRWISKDEIAAIRTGDKGHWRIKVVSAPAKAS